MREIRWNITLISGEHSAMRGGGPASDASFSALEVPTRPVSLQTAHFSVFLPSPIARLFTIQLDPRPPDLHRVRGC